MNCFNVTILRSAETVYGGGMCLTEEADGIICLGYFVCYKLFICWPHLKCIQIHIYLYIWYIHINFLLQCREKWQEPCICQCTSAALHHQPSCSVFSPLVTIKLSLLFRYHSCLHISILAPAVLLLLFLALFAKAFLGKYVFFSDKSHSLHMTFPAISKPW